MLLLRILVPEDGNAGSFFVLCMAVPGDCRMKKDGRHCGTGMFVYCLFYKFLE